jgi:hypothetical protein
VASFPSDIVDDTRIKDKFFQLQIGIKEECASINKDTQNTKRAVLAGFRKPENEFSVSYMSII